MSQTSYFKIARLVNFCKNEKIPKRAILMHWAKKIHMLVGLRDLGQKNPYVRRGKVKKQIKKK
jgi:hypothetical protein